MIDVNNIMQNLDVGRVAALSKELEQYKGKSKVEKVNEQAMFNQSMTLQNADSENRELKNRLK